jgi:hypothetical protein
VTLDPIVSRGCIIHTSRRTLSWGGGGSLKSLTGQQGFLFHCDWCTQPNACALLPPKVPSECYSLPLSPPFVVPPPLSLSDFSVLTKQGKVKVKFSSA